MQADIAEPCIRQALAPLIPARPALAARMAAHLPPLGAALDALYADHPDYVHAVTGLAAALAAACAARAPDLCALDAAREAAPGWFLGSEMIGYSAYVDRFGGTLAGVAERVPYLQALGVRYLHLLPFWRARAGDSDGGFAVADYAQVEPHLGSMADLDALAARLRAAGISLCADLVLNHTADDHAWALAARAGNPAARGFYHVLADSAEVAAYEASLPQVFPQTAPGNFTYVPEMHGWLWTTFYPYQWDLNYANPAVFVAMAGVVMTLANRGVEAFRLDSAAFLWKRLGTTCRSQPETHTVIRALRALMAIAAPGVLLKSEVIAPVVDAAAYLGSDAAPECHLAYHAGLMTAGWAALAEGDASTVRAVLQAAPAPPHGAGWVTYVRCHDDIGWQPLAPQAGQAADGTAMDDAQVQARLRTTSDFYTDGRGFARGEAFQPGGDAAHGINGTAASLVGFETAHTTAEEDAALARLRLLAGLAFAAGGLPLLFMGDETGQLNDWGYAEDPARRHEGRWLHRGLFDAEEAASPRATRVRAMVAELAAARLGLPALDAGTAPAVIAVQGAGIVAFRRGPRHVVMCNFADRPERVALDGSWHALLGTAPSGGWVELGAYGMAWLAASPTPS